MPNPNPKGAKPEIWRPSPKSRDPQPINGKERTQDFGGASWETERRRRALEGEGRKAFELLKWKSYLEDGEERR